MISEGHLPISMKQILEVKTLYGEGEKKKERGTDYLWKGKRREGGRVGSNSLIVQWNVVFFHTGPDN